MDTTEKMVICPRRGDVGRNILSGNSVVYYFNKGFDENGA